MENFTNDSTAHSTLTQTSIDRPISLFPLSDLEWNLRAIRKSTLTAGYHGYTYIIRVEEKNYFQTYNLGPDYYTISSSSTCRRFEWLSVRGKATPYESTIAYVGENRMVGFNAVQNRAHFDECDNDEMRIQKQLECMQDPVVYNAYQTCVNVECARVVEYLMRTLRTRVHVVSIDYPNITFSLSNTSMQTSYDVNTAEREMQKIVNDICKYVTMVSVQAKWAIMFAYPQHDSYIKCTTLNAFNDYPHTEVDVSREASVYADVYRFLSFQSLPVDMRAKTSMYRAPTHIDMSSVAHEYDYLHECFSTKTSHVYAFFDIDIDNVNIDDWTEQVCTLELSKLNRELCALFGVDTFEFSVSRAFRAQKISFHLISNCILVADIYEFKSDLCAHKFVSLLGQHIDMCVYKNNGSLRIATKYKETMNRQRDESTRLNIITGDNVYNHLITKITTSKCRFITSQASEYFKSLEENVELREKLDYRTVIEPSKLKSLECKLNLIDQLIDVYFTYEKCFSDITRMYKFVSCVACMSTVATHGNVNSKSNSKSNTIDDVYERVKNATTYVNEYERRLIERIEQSTSKNREHKIRVVRKLFRRQTKEHQQHTRYNYYIDRLAQTHKCTIGKDINMTLELNIRTCVINTQYLSSEDLNIDRFVHSRFERLFVKSTMGTGKTEALFRFLVQRPLYIRVLIVCSRRSMVEEMKKRMCENDLEYVANSSDENFSREILTRPNCGVIITTCESLYKLGMYIDEFQLIVCDEMEAVIDQMSSGETHRSRLNENNYQFSMYLRNAKLLAMDGQLTENAMRMHQIPNRSLYLVNKYEVKKNISRAYDREEFFQIMSVMYKEGKRVAIATDTRIACITLYEMLSGKQYDPKSIDDDFIIYNSDTSASIDITSIDMRDKTVIYTPSMDVSVSITAHVPDTIFGYFTNSQVSAYCKSQMLMRFRHTTDILIYEAMNIQSNDTKLKNLLFDIEHERAMDLCARKETKVCNTLKNLDGMKKFKFNNLAKIYDRFVSKTMNEQASAHQYNIHKTFKRLSCMHDLVRIERRPVYENLVDEEMRAEEKVYSKIYTELYNINSYKYSFGVHIESVLSEIVSMLDSPVDTFKYSTPFEKKSISSCVYVVMEKYQWLNLNKYSSQEAQVKGALSIIYHLSSYYDEHQYVSLDDFRARFLGREHIIRLFVALVRARNRQCQMFLILLLRSMFIYNNIYYIDMACLQHQASTIALKYFREISKARVKYYLRKYLPSVQVMDANPNPDMYVYVDIFSSAEQYNNFATYTKNIVSERILDVSSSHANIEMDMCDDNTEYNTHAINDDLLVSTSHTATYLSKFIHRISLNDLARVEFDYVHQPNACENENVRRHHHRVQVTATNDDNTNNAEHILMEDNMKQRRKEVNLQFILIARDTKNGNLVCVNFARDSYKNSSVHPNVYTSTMYEYEGVYSDTLTAMLDVRNVNYIVMKPIECERTSFVTKEALVKFIDTSIKYDLNVKKLEWKSKAYKMYENKAISILNAIDSSINKLVDDHLAERETSCDRVYRRHGYEPLVVYDITKRRAKKNQTTGIRTIFDVDDCVGSKRAIEAGSQGIVSDYRQKLLDQQQIENGTAKFVRWEENPDCNAIECECIYCMPNKVYTPATMPYSNSININECMNEQSRHLLNCMSVYREIISEYLSGFDNDTCDDVKENEMIGVLQRQESTLTISKHAAFVVRDMYICAQMCRVANDPTCYVVSDEYKYVAI